MVCIVALFDEYVPDVFKEEPIDKSHKFPVQEMVLLVLKVIVLSLKTG